MNKKIISFVIILILCFIAGKVVMSFSGRKIIVDSSNSVEVSKNAVEDEVAINMKAVPALELAEKIISDLVLGRTDSLIKNFDPGVRASISEEEYSRFIIDMKSFFNTVKEVDKSVVVRPSSREGATGFSFEKRVVIKDGTSETVKVYIIEGQKNLVVSNIIFVGAEE